MASSLHISGNMGRTMLVLSYKDGFENSRCANFARMLSSRFKTFENLLKIYNLAWQKHKYYLHICAVYGERGNQLITEELMELQRVATISSRNWAPTIEQFQIIWMRNGKNSLSKCISICRALKSRTTFNVVDYGWWKRIEYDMKKSPNVLNRQNNAEHGVLDWIGRVLCVMNCCHSVGRLILTSRTLSTINNKPSNQN